jgi:phenylpyruvate tautomerase PptA (4-oxalocrotonate tautomerase family)
MKFTDVDIKSLHTYFQTYGSYEHTPAEKKANLLQRISTLLSRVVTCPRNDYDVLTLHILGISGVFTAQYTACL